MKGSVLVAIGGKFFGAFAAAHPALARFYYKG